jgi:ferredoxin
LTKPILRRRCAYANSVRSTRTSFGTDGVNGIASGAMRLSRTVEAATAWTETVQPASRISADLFGFAEVLARRIRARHRHRLAGRRIAHIFTVLGHGSRDLSRCSAAIAPALAMTKINVLGSHLNYDPSMPYVITEPCIGTKDRSCVDVCPVDCIHGDDSAPQLYIDPEVCIDCGACVSACPVEAIYADADVPEKWKHYAGINADYFK